MTTGTMMIFFLFVLLQATWFVSCEDNNNFRIISLLTGTYCIYKTMDQCNSGFTNETDGRFIQDCNTHCVNKEFRVG